MIRIADVIPKEPGKVGDQLQGSRFVFSTDLKTFLAMGTGEVGVGEAISSGRAVLEGDPETAVQCARMFAIPGVVQDESPRR